MHISKKGIDEMEEGRQDGGVKRDADIDEIAAHVMLPLCEDGRACRGNVMIGAFG